MSLTEIRVLLVDDHELVRAGFRSILEGEEGIEVVGEVGDGRRAVAMVEDLAPDVVLMDLTMPELNGLVATERIVRESEDVKVLVLSVHREEQWVREAFKAGAAGYLVKSAAREELPLAVRAVARGEQYVSVCIVGAVVRGYLSSRAEGSASPLDRLTPRQREVLQLVAEGHSSKAVAKKLGISSKTVERHRADIMKKLDVHAVPGLVRFAVRSGLVPLEPEGPS